MRACAMAHLRNASWRTSCSRFPKHGDGAGAHRAAGVGMTIICVGISHKQAPIEVRERLVVRSEELPGRLQALRRLPGLREVFLLSTCNRLEVFAAADSRDAAEKILQSLDPVAIVACRDRKSTRLNSSHFGISYAVFCLQQKTMC